MNDLAATFHDSSRLMLAFARVVRNYALRVHSDPLAGRGPCGRPPWQGNQFPILGADGHKGRALQMAILLIPMLPLTIRRTFRSSCRARPLWPSAIAG